MPRLEDFKKYLIEQVKEIEIYKWIRSEQEKKDIGKDIAATEWISLYAEHYRNCWLCKYKCPQHNHNTCPLYSVIIDVQKFSEEEVFEKDKDTRKKCVFMQEIKKNGDCI